MSDLTMLLERVRSGEMVMSDEALRNLEREVEAERIALRAHEERTARGQRAVDAGWEPYIVPADMWVGRLGPRMRQPVDPVSFFLVTGMNMASVAFLAYGFVAHDIGYALPLACVVFLWWAVRFAPPRIGGVMQALRSGLDVETWHQDRYVRVQGHEFDPFFLTGRIVDVRFVGAMPRALHEKAVRDRDLFDGLYVASHDASLFVVDVQPPPRPRLVDPLLLGRIGGQWYLGGQWDIASEVRAASAR